MKPSNRRQFISLGILLVVYALAAFLTYAFFTAQLAATAGTPMPDMGVSPAVLGLANAGIVLVVYGLLGAASYWFARKQGWPGIFSENGNWRRWFLIPLALGLICGAVLIVGDILFAPINGFGRMVHPGFPVSILASLSAGIGEELLFRGFVLGLWGFLLNLLFRRFNLSTVGFWIANTIAALAFAAAHLETVLVLAHASSLAALNPILIVEVFLLNGVVGLVAGERARKDGLVAAMGVHFWCDMAFHVLWGLI